MAGGRRRPSRPPRLARAKARKPVARPAAVRAAGRRASGGKPTPREAAPVAQLATTALRLAGEGSEAVMRATGRAWDEWLNVLDRAGAATLPHREIARAVGSRFSLPTWWSQMVTVGYERARGLRARRRSADGVAVHASGTVRIGLDKLRTAWSEPVLRARWLPGAPIDVRRAIDGKSMRITWTAGGPNVDASFASKGPDRSVEQVEPGRLAGAGAVDRQRASWGEALGRLKALLEGKR